MIRDDIMEWLIIAVMAAAAILVLMLVVGTGAPAARGNEEQAEREYLMWHEEWADVREAQEAYLRERRGRR